MTLDLDQKIYDTALAILQKRRTTPVRGATNTTSSLVLIETPGTGYRIVVTHYWMLAAASVYVTELTGIANPSGLLLLQGVVVAGAADGEPVAILDEAQSLNIKLNGATLVHYRVNYYIEEV